MVRTTLKNKLLTLKKYIVNSIKTLYTMVTYKAIMLIPCIILVAIFFNIYRYDVEKQINENTKTYLSSVVNESLDRISLKMEEEFKLLKTIALYFNHVNNLNDENVIEILQEQMDKNSFVGVQIIGSDSLVKIAIGKNSNSISKELISETLKEGKYISSIIFDEVTSKEYIELAVPLCYNNEPIAILVSYYEIDEFTNVIDTSYFQQLGTTFIAQEDGILVSRPESVGKNTNLFTLLDSININNEKSIKKLKNNIKNGESGIISYSTGKHKRYICYSQIPDSKWYSVSIVSGNAIEPLAKKVSKLAIALIMEIISVFVLYIFVIICIEFHFKKKFQKNI